MLLEVSQSAIEQEVYKLDLHLENGKAIGLRWAASCVDDMMRTKKFIKELMEDVQNRIAQKPAPIHILYAGTGPFAILILPVLACYSPAEIQVTLMEINKESFEGVKKCFNQLQLETYVKEYIHEDATTYINNQSGLTIP
jgi:tRNA G37 N-methylase Trm5